MEQWRAEERSMRFMFWIFGFGRVSLTCNAVTLPNALMPALANSWMSTRHSKSVGRSLDPPALKDDLNISTLGLKV